MQDINRTRRWPLVGCAVLTLLIAALLAPTAHAQSICDRKPWLWYCQEDPTPPPPPPPTKLKVMAWNIGEDDSRAAMNIIADTVKSQAPDVVLLNEIGVTSGVGDYLDQPRYIAA